MKTTTSYAPLLTLLFGVAACGGPDADEGRKVDASGKEATALDAVPAEVLAVARASQPELTLREAEYETRDGNEYYDVGGTLPDGSELELDMTKVDGVWTVVETQRDIGMDLLPEAVSGALSVKFPAWQPERIIESDQSDGVVIYEFFGRDEADEATKIEIKWADSHAELLLDEWAH
jgi:hypothetical protein